MQKKLYLEYTIIWDSNSLFPVIRSSPHPVSAIFSSLVSQFLCWWLHAGFFLISPVMHIILGVDNFLALTFTPFHSFSNTDYSLCKQPTLSCFAVFIAVTEI